MDHFKGRVALIHENQEFCEEAAKFFESQGYWVQPCHYVADAVGPMLQTAFGEVDILVVDAQIAQSGALNVLKRLMKHRPDFPVGAVVLPRNQAQAERLFVEIWPEAKRYLAGYAENAIPGLMRHVAAESTSDEGEEFETESEYFR